MFFSYWLLNTSSACLLLNVARSPKFQYALQPENLLYWLTELGIDGWIKEHWFALDGNIFWVPLELQFYKLCYK